MVASTKRCSTICFERGVVHAATGVAQVTAGGGRADILGELLGQRGEILALGQASLDLVDLRLGLLVADLVVHLDQDVCGIALLGKVGDFLLVQRLEVFLLHLDLVEEGGLLQLHVFDDHLLGSHELALVAFVEGLHLVVAHAALGGVGLDRQGGEVAGLLLEASEGLQFVVGDETGARQAGAKLADEHFLAEHLAELHAAVVHLADDLVEAIRVELAVDLELGSLQDQLVQRLVGEGELVVLGGLEQQGTLDQPLQGRFLEQLVIQHGWIEILAQALQQLATLHVHGLLDFIETDIVAVDLGGHVGVVGGPDDRVEAGQRQENDDHANDGLGDPALGIIPDVLQHAAPKNCHDQPSWAARRG